MATPNVQVLEAIVESYLSSRLSSWGIDPDNFDESKYIDPNTLHKLTICQNAIALMRGAKTENDWVDVCGKLYDLEVKEGESVKNSWMASQPILELTLRALRSYIILKIENGSNYTKALDKHKATAEPNPITDLDKLLDRLSDIGNSQLRSIEDAETMLKELQENLTQEIHRRQLGALRDYPADLRNYHTTHFTNVTLAKDPKAKSLHEQSFADFELSVEKGDRTPALYEQLFANAEDKKAKSSPLQTHSLHSSPYQTRSRTSTRLPHEAEQHESTSRRRSGRRHN